MLVTRLSKSFFLIRTPLEPTAPSRLQMMNNPLRESGAGGAGFGGVAGELAGDVVGDVEFSARTAAGDLLAFGEGGFQGAGDHTGGFVPAHVLQHQDSGEQD